MTATRPCSVATPVRRGEHFRRSTRAPNASSRSLKRRPDGSHEAIASEQLIVEVAERLADIVDRHGPNSVAMYTGTSNIAYPTMGGMAASLLRALGSSMFFSAATIDQPGVMVADAVHGLLARRPQPVRGRRRLALRRHEPDHLEAVPRREPGASSCTGRSSAGCSSW